MTNRGKFVPYKCVVVVRMVSIGLHSFVYCRYCIFCKCVAWRQLQRLYSISDRWM